ncbi:ABC transporter permease [Clostridium sp. AF18-27]|uniref:Putative ABC transport system permease protein n=3 Tax=Enterocloster TaxID=2719313 RepID=A0A1I0AP30_9FIRM|nr:ABC transporter permease [Enterocloster lavalensis]PST33420.1 ABC transporter permease [Enterocloster lavalensis]RHR53886.1 ABC transporter permease [Clostridium sp. AF18-27]SES95926.1 putative ABC transport system permease protein [Enterocloster lavalensis]
MLQSFKLAIRSIWGNKMRSFLTMLGIIIGVAAVIILVSLVNGYMGSVVESFASMGVNQINVNVTNLSSRSLDVDEMYAFYDEHTDLFDGLSPNVTVSTTIKHGDDSLTSTSVAGRSEQYLEIKDYKLEQGRNLSYADIAARQKVCVIGAYVAQELYGGAEKALGETLKVGGYAFKIVGVVEAQDEDDLEQGGTDDFVWLPYSVAVKMSRNANISSYTFTIIDTTKAEECKTQIENYLYEIFKDDDLYRVTAMSEMLDSLNEQIAMMSGMLGGIAGISLLVAGVGVMNIMLVSVTERTREIGIRKSLGADKSVIMRQFVIEAAVTSSLGGLIGILIGCVATTAVGAAVGINATPTPAAIIISFSVSVGIGLLFGYMPASRAANLNPIDALRSE